MQELSQYVVMYSYHVHQLAMLHFPMHFVSNDYHDIFQLDWLFIVVA